MLAMLLVTACAADHESDATLAVKDYVDDELDALRQAVLDLAAAAPAPDADGWNASEDAAAVAAMRDAWLRARISYERIEGAIAVLFPHLDESTDERYDGFIESATDDDLFDGAGVTGMHAIERILWADAHPAHVVAFESALLGYTPASYPVDEGQATRFRDALVGRLLDDVSTMRDQFAPLALDPAAAFRGVIGSMAEQLEKVTLAATGEDESRYSQKTLADMRANLEGGQTIYRLFQPWVRSVDGGADRDANVEAGFARMQAEYAMTVGDSLPPVPDGWNPDAPDPAHLATPYGRIWQLLSAETDRASSESLVSDMNAAAGSIGIPLLP